jgi:hypothetical protein
MVMAALLQCSKNECQWSNNDIWAWITQDARAVQQRESRIELSTAILGKIRCDNISTIFSKLASMEYQQLFAFHPGKCMGCTAT